MMGRVNPRGEGIRRFILKHVEANPQTISNLTMAEFTISRQAAHQHLTRLVKKGFLTSKGITHRQSYQLATVKSWSKKYRLSATDEETAWTQDVRPILGGLPPNVMDIWWYGFSEMFNNAIDHSGGKTIVITIQKTAVSTRMTLLDDGVGIFKKIQTALRLSDAAHAVLELTKGKYTTDPSKHSGEGIFFTSRFFDTFSIMSGKIYLLRKSKDPNPVEWVIEKKFRPGTCVRLKIANDATQTQAEIYNQYAVDADNLAFDKTVIPVKLAEMAGDKLISRSQAKRLLARVGLFRTVILDFTDVDTVGQAFADEIFRVFVNEHPRTEILSSGTNQAVRQMIRRAQQTNVADIQDGGPP